jgi:Ca2+-binding RTX toxin-like protein
LNFHTVAHVAGEIRGQLVRIATDASETVTGTSGIDVLPGLGGDDVLIGGAGADVIDGGAGIDTASYDPSGAVNVSLATGTGTGGDAEGDTLTNIENLIGSQFNDTLTGDADDNVLDGGAGGDLLTGGGGDDTYIVDSGFDVLVEAPNEGTDTVIASLRWTLATNFENLTLVGSGNFFGTGNNVANVITGNSGANVLDGKGGNDTLSGGDGFDTLIGGAGNDVMMGGTGNDKYIVDSVNDSVSEEVGEGTDTVRSSVTFTLGANVENLSLLGAAAIDGTGNSLVNIMVGNSAANTLLGLDGNDNLAGLGGNDVLAGGAGRDRLNGGAGADAFVFDTTPVNVTNTDVIADFTPGEDQIWLDSAVYTALGGPGALAAGALHIVTSGFAAADAADRIIYNSSNGALWYDADGNGAGAAVFFAQLSAGLALTEADFLVI